jgi:acyl carrier protein
MVAEVLHIPVENIGNDAHLIFDLGASSFQYLSLIMLLEERLHVAGFLESGEKCYTVTQLCEYIERHL